MVPAGKYTIWTLPAPDGWTLIINKQTDSGARVHPEQDLVRVQAKVETLRLQSSNSPSVSNRRRTDDDYLHVGQERYSVPWRRNKVHLDFAVVADYALVDQSGKMSVLGIFQHIWVPQFPAMHPRLHLVLRLKGRRTEVGSTRYRSS